MHLRTTHGSADSTAIFVINAACIAKGEVNPALPSEYHIPLGDLERWLDHSDPADWLLIEHKGQIVGYGQTLWHWLEKDGRQIYLHKGRVHPDFRGQGAGTLLLNGLEQRCREKASAAGHLETLEMAANCSDTEPEAKKLLQDHGYFVAFTNLEMSLSLEGDLPPLPALPENYELRPALPEHFLAIWQSIINAYDARDAANLRFGEVPSPDSYDKYFSKDASLFFVAWMQTYIAAQVLAEIRPDGTAELYEVSVGVAHQRRGLAGTLMLQALHELKRRGVKEVWIGTRRENPSQAWRQYEKLGFRTVKTFPRWRKGSGQVS